MLECICGLSEENCLCGLQIPKKVPFKDMGPGAQAYFRRVVHDPSLRGKDPMDDLRAEINEFDRSQAEAAQKDKSGIETKDGGKASTADVSEKQSSPQVWDTSFYKNTVLFAQPGHVDLEKLVMVSLTDYWLLPKLTNSSLSDPSCVHYCCRQKGWMSELLKQCEQ